MILLLIDLLCYYFTKWRIFYWIAVVMIISYLAALAFAIGMSIQLISSIIYELELLNFITDSNKYEKIIEEYQNELTEVCKRIQEIKEEEFKI